MLSMPPVTRQGPPPVTSQAPPPRTRQAPPDPRAEHTGKYGQRVGGMHPTGIQSCDRSN